jgi:hypothetical protein
MTIAAGFVATDGILLFADTQHTSYCDKTYRRKIISAKVSQAMVHFAIAGDDDYAASAVEDCRESLSAIEIASPSAWEVRKVIRRTIKKVIEDYEKRSLSPDQKPEFIVSVGSYKDGLKLFSSRETAIPPVEDYDFRGSGRTIASYIMHSFGPRVINQTMEGLLPIALHILSAAHKQDPNCGGGAQFVALSQIPALDQSGLLMRASDVCTMDRLGIDAHVREYEYWSGALFSLAVGAAELSDEEFNKRLAVIGERFAEIRADIMRPPSEYMNLVSDIRSIRPRPQVMTDSVMQLGLESPVADQPPQPPSPETPEGSDES